jgi:hypothetical protein
LFNDCGHHNLLLDLALPCHALGLPGTQFLNSKFFIAFQVTARIAAHRTRAFLQMLMQAQSLTANFSVQLLLSTLVAGVGEPLTRDFHRACNAPRALVSP